ncbi:MAG: CHAT domain-containing protein, partial [Cyanobacteria bacterium P01_F01_bin.4]
PIDQLQARLAQLNLYIQQQKWPKVATLAPQIQQQLGTLSPGRTSVYATINFAYHLSRVEPSHLPISKPDINALLAQAVQAAHALQDARAEAHALVQMGKLYSQTQQKREALSLTEQSLALARSIQADDVISQSAWQLGSLLKQQGNPQAAIAAYSEAVEALQSLRGDLVAINQDVQFSYREQVEPVYRELVALLLEEKTQPALKQARDVLEALQVAELDNFFREACLDLQTSQIDQIDPNATVVYSIMLPDRLAMIYSKAGQPLQAYETPVEATTVQQTLRSYLSATHPSADRQQRLDKAQQIYDWLIRPAEASLTSDQTLVFVLDGLLRNIPIAALYDGEHYLIEKYAVALSPGLQLIQARSLDRHVHALVGGISEPRGQFSALPAVESELENIANTVSSSILLNQRFTRDAIVDNMKSGAIDVVHLATHGQFSSNFNDTFFLTWDGTININELSEILRSREDNLNQAIELLTLSACETAAGDDRAILGLAGLAVRSGARATVATLWPIKDEAAAKMMTTFYHWLSDTSVSKAEALRQAQLSLLHDRDFADPFFWSAYVLIGNWI